MNAVTALLTPAEACAYLRISRRTLQRLASEGRIVEVRLSERIVRYYRHDLDQYVAEAREAGEARAQEAIRQPPSKSQGRRRGRPRKEEEVAKRVRSRRKAKQGNG